MAFNAKDTAVKIDDYNVSAESFRTLRPGEWLDDQVINAYMRLLHNEGNKMGNIFIFDVNFLKSFEGNEYLATEFCEGLEIFDPDMLAVIVPVHANSNHWSLIVICPAEHEIFYLDSLAGNGQQLLEKTFKFVRYRFDLENPEDCDPEDFFRDWELCDVNKFPEQRNGVGCGVFLCQYVFQLIVGYDFDINENIEYYRQKIAAELNG